MPTFVFWTGIYDFALALGIAIDPIRDTLGMRFSDSGPPYVIALLLCYIAATLVIASRDIPTYAPIIYWEGILRLAFFPVLVRYGFFGDFGPVAGLIGCVDAAIGLIYLIGLATYGFSHRELLLAKTSMAKP